MKSVATKTKFQIGAASILLIFCIAISWAAYDYLRDLVTEEIYNSTEIFVGTADATRTYVKDVLRPKISELVDADRFIPQAMSTTFVGREVLGRLQQRFPDFHYKRAALDPMNPVNQADDFERSMLQWFAAHRNQAEWYGLIKKNNRSYFSRFRAIYAESECLSCHGDPADAPGEMKEIYGIDGGYHYNVGDVVAADTIYIPVDVTFVRVKEAAWLVFLIAAISLLSMLGLFYLLFNRTVLSEMKGLLFRFQRISTKEPEQPPALIPGDTNDEFELLKGAFEHVAAELKETHDELKASESKYRLLFETSRDALLIFDENTRLKDINEAGLRLFGLRDRAEALSVETFFQLFQDARDAEKFFEEVKANGFVQGFEAATVNRRGQKRIVMISANARRDEAGCLTGVDGMFHDVTEMRRMERYLAQTEKLASIGQLASGVAHEINNPLGVIKCYANLIAKAGSPEGQLMKDIRIIQKHTDQCKSVVEALLNFARMSEPKKTKSDINECLGDVMSVLEPQLQKKGIQVQKETAPQIPPVTIDTQQIKQVLMNLFMNAQQAMQGGGKITASIYVRENDRWLVVEIKDTGTGIPEKFLHRIFDPFFTTKDAGKGTGLGLSVSYGIVKQHGGEIEVESTAGLGSTFRVVLPVEDLNEMHRTESENG